MSFWTTLTSTPLSMEHLSRAWPTPVRRASGGSRQSGTGREVGPRALDFSTEAKFISIDHSGGLEGNVYGLVLSPAG